MESCVLSAISKLKKLFRNPRVQIQSGSVPKTSHNSSRRNQAPKQDRFQNIPHPEARVALSQSSQNCCVDDAYERFFSSTFTCGTHATLCATSMQRGLLLQARKPNFWKLKYLQSLAKVPASASSTAITPRVSSWAKCSYVILHPADEVPATFMR